MWVASTGAMLAGTPTSISPRVWLQGLGAGFEPEAAQDRATGTRAALPSPREAFDIESGDPLPAPGRAPAFSSFPATPVPVGSLSKRKASIEQMAEGQEGSENLSEPTSYDEPIAYEESSVGVVGIIYAAADEFGVDGGYLVSIAQCESSLSPGAYSSAGYKGLFQYDDATWATWGYGSVWDPIAQARTTAELISLGQSARWPNCG